MAVRANVSYFEWFFFSLTKDIKSATFIYVEDENLDTDVDSIIAERNRLDKVFTDKFTKVVSVMFTDLKGSTSIAETEGDFATRSLIKHHNDIIFPIIKKHNGVLVKTMGDGTMSYFATAQEAVRAAVEAQKSMDAFNLGNTIATNIFMRIGIHTGTGIVEKNDIFGDVVNVASRFEGQANAGEICISEETFNKLSDKSEIYCRFIKETTLKGKKEPVKVYKAFWNPEEIELDMAGTIPVQQKEFKKGHSLVTKLILFVVLPLLIIFFIAKVTGILGNFSSEESRSTEYNVTMPSGAK